MRGNALDKQNVKKLKQARFTLARLKEMKLKQREEKYHGTSANLLDIMSHLGEEFSEVFQEFLDTQNNGEKNYFSLALEIADLSNCCDLVIFEIMDDLSDQLSKVKGE